MKTYLLDTNICIFFIKGQYQLNRKIANVGQQNCFISEVTVAELKYGIENSKTIEPMRLIVEAFILQFSVIPIFNALDIYAREKAKLRKKGLLIDDFDICYNSGLNCIIITRASRILLPLFLVVSIIDLITANESAPLSDLN